MSRACVAAFAVITMVQAGCSDTVVGQFSPPALLPGTDVIDFGAVPVGQSSLRQLSIGNAGDETLSISELVLTGDSRRVFSFAPSTLSIKSGATANVTVTYTPLILTEDQAGLTFVSNAVSGKDSKVQLRGRGVGAVDAGFADAQALSDAAAPDAEPRDLGSADAVPDSPDAGFSDATPEDQGVVEADAGPSGDASVAVPPYGSCASPCPGPALIVQNTAYNKYVAIVRCSASRYDLLMGETSNGPFYKIADWAGHGQDHCELVNPTFTIPNEDDVASGTCPTCAVEWAGPVTELPGLFGASVYVRGTFGTAFELTSDLHPGYHTSCWYECGVSFP